VSSADKGNCGALLPVETEQMLLILQDVCFPTSKPCQDSSSRYEQTVVIMTSSVYYCKCTPFYRTLYVIEVKCLGTSLLLAILSENFYCFYITFLVTICRLQVSSDTNLNLLRPDTYITPCSVLTIL
jgi:hypothetical protein